jgi:uroporphyrinogen decarboxylase
VLKSREIVLKVFNGEIPDRMPVALIGGGMWSVNHSKTTFEALAFDAGRMSEIIIKMSEVLQSDIVYVGSGFPNIPAAALGGKVKFRGVGAVELEGPVVSSEEEFQKLDPALLEENEIIRTIRKAFDITQSRIGGKYLVSMTAWGPFTLGARIIGEETLIKGVLKKPEYVDRVLSFATDLIKLFFKPLVESSSIELITIGDPTASGDLISRKQFERYALPHLKKFNDWARSHGVHTLLHVCGDTSDRLDLYPQTGATCISLDHKTDISLAREVLHGKMCFAGNVDPVNVLFRGTVKDVEEHCRRIIEHAGMDGGFILMPGCDIPPTVPLENIQQFVAAGRHEGPCVTGG